MIELEVDVAVVGAGPAGLAAACAAREAGARRVLVIDRNSWLGGILPQCIHDGFGVEETGHSLTGPEYAEMYVSKARALGVAIMGGAMVLELRGDRHLVVASPKGMHSISAGSVVLAMGCRERTRWHSLIPGTRPSGVFTAGVAQAFVNLYNRMVGRRVVVLGSGNVGLIMARRLRLEGAHVVGVVEALPEATGLPRNVVQCLEDYDIPLYTGHTVTGIFGRERVESVEVSRLDPEMRPVPGTSSVIECDCLLLSLGLIPENELSRGAGIEMDQSTGGPVVSQDLETSVPGVFACGNCLHVHDTVDMLAVESRRAGANAAAHRSQITRGRGCAVRAGPGVRYVVPQLIDSPGTVELSLRSVEKLAPATLTVRSRDRILLEKRLRYASPPNMIKVTIDVDGGVLSSREMEVSIDG